VKAGRRFEGAEATSPRSRIGFAVRGGEVEHHVRERDMEKNIAADTAVAGASAANVVYLVHGVIPVPEVVAGIRRDLVELLRFLGCFLRSFLHDLLRGLLRSFRH